jgi:hypothetical protein
MAAGTIAAMAAVIPVTFLFNRGCPSADAGRELLERAADDAGVVLEVRQHEVTSDGEAEQLGFAGSPTYLVDGRDPFTPEPDALMRHDACRIYVGADGAARPLPGREELAAALRAAAGGGPAREAA